VRFGITSAGVVRVIRLVVLLLALFYAGAVSMMLDTSLTRPVRDAVDYWLVTTDWGVTPLEKIQNDLDIYPYRHLLKGSYVPPADRDYRELALPGMRDRRAAPLIYVAPDRDPALSAVSMLTDDAAGLYSVVLLDPAGEVLHQWPITEAFAPWPHRPITNVLPHAFELFPDGSMISVIDKGRTLARVDACGEPIWMRELATHHSVVRDGPDHVWTWDFHDMIRVQVADGEIVHRVSLQDVIEANPETDVLGVIQRTALDAYFWGPDPLHPNDVEALPADLAAAFPGFEAGDLVISLRSLNMLLVIDPETARIRWWRMGIGRRQHDPDWMPDGTILFYDNNINREFSRIRRIDPESYRVTDVLDGADHDFLSGALGRQQLYPDGTMIVSSGLQGRLFEVGPDGRVTLELVNRYDAANTLFAIVTEGHRLPLDYFDETPSCAEGP